MINMEMSIIQAWTELRGIEYRIDLLKTLRESNGDVKASKVKEILVKGGLNSDSMLNIIQKKDEYTDRLQALYTSKGAYEEFIEKEIQRLKISDIQLAVVFLKEYKKMKWLQIARKLGYSETQIRRFYREYKGKIKKS